MEEGTWTALLPLVLLLATLIGGPVVAVLIARRVVRTIGRWLEEGRRDAGRED